MNLTIKTYNGITLLTAEGTITEPDFRKIADELEKLPATAEKFVLLDCSGLKNLILSSAGFSGFISQILYIRSYNANVTLVGCNEQAIKLFELLKLEDKFQFAYTLDDAYLNLKQLIKAAPATHAAA